MRVGIVTVMILALGVSACSRGDERDIRLHRLRSEGRAPEEFSVLPTKGVEIPADLTALPTPTPGGANRSDLTPIEDAVAALGGQASAVTPTGTPSASDQALLAQASRFGSDPAIRQTLADEDLAFRRENSRFTQLKIVPEDRYMRVYSEQVLDAYAWLEQMRAAGIETPTAPPKSR